jgi:hypothetical protein
MTEPSTARPVPGPPPRDPAAVGPAGSADVGDRFDDLDQRPVAEHVAVFEAEHDRLQRELGTIDQL